MLTLGWFDSVVFTVDCAVPYPVSQSPCQNSAHAKEAKLFPFHRLHYYCTFTIYLVVSRRHTEKVQVVLGGGGGC